MREFFFFEETHGELTKRIESKETDVRIVVATDLRCSVSVQDEDEMRKLGFYLIEMFTNDLP